MDKKSESELSTLSKKFVWDEEKENKKQQEDKKSNSSNKEAIKNQIEKKEFVNKIEEENILSKENNENTIQGNNNNQNDETIREFDDTKNNVFNIAGNNNIMNKTNKTNESKPTNTLSVRLYLDTYVMGSLREGYDILYNKKPENPLQFLGNFLIEKSKTLGYK